MEMRNVNIDIDHIINLDKEHRLAETTMQSIKAEQNKINKEIGIIRSKGGDYLPLMEKTKSIEKDFIDAQTKTENLSQELRAILESIPNILDPDVHYGKSDEDAKELKVYGNKKNFNFDPLEHFDIGEKMKNMDFITAAKISGSDRQIDADAGALPNSRFSRRYRCFCADSRRKWNGKRIGCPRHSSTEQSCGIAVCGSELCGVAGQYS